MVEVDIYMSISQRTLLYLPYTRFQRNTSPIAVCDNLLFYKNHHFSPTSGTDTFNGSPSIARGGHFSTFHCLLGSALYTVSCFLHAIYKYRHILNR